MRHPIIFEKPIEFNHKDTSVILIAVIQIGRYYGAKTANTYKNDK